MKRSKKRMRLSLVISYAAMAVLFITTAAPIRQVGQNVAQPARYTHLDVVAMPDSVLTGTTTVNASTTVTGVGTVFLSEVHIGDRISVSSAAATYATVTAIASNTSLTVSVVLGNGTSQTINAKHAIWRAVDSSGATVAVQDDLGRIAIFGAGNIVSPEQGLHIEKRHVMLGQVAAPGAPGVAVNATAGTLNGNYQYRIAFLTALGETETGTVSSIVAPASQQVDLSAIPVSIDSAVTARKIYRTTAGGSTLLMKLVATISDNTTTTYTDNIADGSLGATEQRTNSTGGLIYNAGKRVIAVDKSSVIIGWSALENNRGYSNTVVGGNAGGADQASVTAQGMTAVGRQALAFVTTAIDPTAIGQAAFYNNTTGRSGVAAGIDALFANTTGDFNYGFGGWALGSNTTGSHNVGVGWRAGQYQSDGSTALIPNQSIYIGNFSKGLNNSDVNSIVIGDSAIGLGANTVVLGNTSIVTTRLTGNIGLNTSTFGTSAAKTIGMAAGTAPTTSLADMAHLWVADVNGEATKASFMMRSEITANGNGAVCGAFIKSDTGNFAAGYEGMFEINTNDNTVKIWAEGAWRTIASGW